MVNVNYLTENYNDINYFTEGSDIKPSFDILLIKKDNQLSIKTDLVLIKSTPLNIVIDVLLPPSGLEILCDSILIKKDNQLSIKTDLVLIKSTHLNIVICIITTFRIRNIM